LHLSSDHDSQLASVLQTITVILVTQVIEKVKVEPNHIYVVPPNRSLKMIDGCIVVEPIYSVEERRAPVDIFFRTLAESHHSTAVAVVLSGIGANGSMSMKRVKERGGVVFVQNPHEAEYSDMPCNSIATDLVDAVLNGEEIPAKIIAYKDNLGIIEIPTQPQSRPTDDEPLAPPSRRRIDLRPSAASFDNRTVRDTNRSTPRLERRTPGDERGTA